MNIYVGNVARNVNEEQLRSEFEKFGQVASVKVITDKFTGEARGFAFVEMPNADEAQAAINGTNGLELGGQRLRVNEARPREDRPAGHGPRGGGFGGPRGGGFGGPRRNNRF